MNIQNNQAWLIERKLDGGSLYIGRNCCLVSNADAIRFSREIDAKRVLTIFNEMEILPTDKYIVTEHVWIEDKP